MSRRSCPSCHEPLTTEVIGTTWDPKINRRSAGVLVGYCGDCNIVSLPGDHVARISEFPRSSSDRTEIA